MNVTYAKKQFLRFQLKVLMLISWWSLFILFRDRNTACYRCFCTNILLCVIRLDRKSSRWICATATLYINIYLHRGCRKTSFIGCFIVTAENSIWPVVFVFFCSWWTPEDNIYFHRCLELLKITFLWKSMLKMCTK